MMKVRRHDSVDDKLELSKKQARPIPEFVFARG